MHKEHRQRLRYSFLKDGLEGSHAYEIVELLLSLGTHRIDCKHLIKQALKKFGSLKDVLETDSKDLQDIDGIGSNNVFSLKLTQDVLQRYLADCIINKNFIRLSDEVLQYLNHQLRVKNREVFIVIYLNDRNKILKMEELFEGTLTTLVIYFRKVVKRDLNYDATALVFVHNHHSGNPNPKKDDLTTTKQLNGAAEIIDVPIHDRLINAGNDVYSFAEHGLI